MSLIEHSARFILRSYNGDVLHDYIMDAPQLTIGRASDRDISLPHDKLISRRHLRVSREQGGYTLVDEGSANGTYVNGRLLEARQPYVLKTGDRIALGRHMIEVQLTTGPVAPTREPTPAQGSGVQSDVAVQSPPQGPVASQSAVGGAAPAPEVSMLAKFPSTTPMRAVSAEQLRFTSFLPRVVAPGAWFTLQLYVHPERAMEAIERDFALYQDGQSEQPPQVPLDHRLLLHGTSITVVPECQGVTFTPKRLAFVWSEGWHRVELRFSVHRQWEAPNVSGRLSIFAGPLLLGMIPLALRVDPAATDIEEGYAHITTKAYKQIFTAYSRDDTVIMQTCRTIYRLLGFNELARVDELRFGPMSDSALRHLIDESEVFQLFWSANAAKAPYITTEWEYASQLKRGADFLRPVYWDIPLVKVPEPLATLPFTYLPRYAFAPHRQA